MKKVAAVAAAALVLANLLPAQLSPLPSPSSADGVFVQDSGFNLLQWGASPLKNYQLAPSNPFQTPAVNPGIDVYGAAWTDQAPSLLQLNNHGGVLRLIFLGSDATWGGSIGYTYTLQPAPSPCAFTISDTASLAFGDHVDIALGKGSGSTFDFWTTGGMNTFCLFRPENSTLVSGGSVHWTLSPFQVCTFLPGYESYANVDTWVASIDETIGGTDASYRVALQFFYPTAVPVVTPGGQQVPVPEPSTYGMIGAVVLLLTVGLRTIGRRR